MAVHYSSQLQQQQLQIAPSLVGCGPGAGNQPWASLLPQMLVPPSVFSEPVSELTCNGSGSRKRSRDEEPVAPLHPTVSAAALFLNQQQQKQQFLLLNNQIHGNKATQAETDLNNLSVNKNNRVNQSMMTSTSGRPVVGSPSSAISNIIHNSSNATSPAPSSGLISMLHYQSLEVDALVRLHTEKLRSDLEEVRKRQCRAVLAAVVQQAQRRIAEKQAELEAATKRNVELEEHLRQAVAESQVWLNVARNSEALVGSLHASLEQALEQKLIDGNDDGKGNREDGGEVEGYGDSEEEAVTAGATATSVVAAVPGPVGCVAEVSSRCVVAGANTSKVASTNGIGCRSCGSSDACVLVLPCRHLSLCRSCEPQRDDCPVCGSRKNGSLLINLC